MMRSKSLTLTSLMAGASLTLGACNGSPPSSQAEAQVNKDPVEAFAYANLDQCKTEDKVSDEECDKAYAAALKDNETNAPKYSQQANCEEVYGVGQCVPRSSAGHGSFFTPLLTGFIIGRMLDGGGYRGTGLYRRDDRYGGGYYTGWGGRVNHDYATGRTTVGREGIDPPSSVRNAPSRVQSRSTVVSRGGFGGGGRSFGGGRGG